MFKLPGFLQDDTGANSVKRLVFLALATVYIVLCLVPLWRGFTDAALYAFLNSTQDKLETMIQWLGAYILVETVAPVVSNATTAKTKNGAVDPLETA